MSFTKVIQLQDSYEYGNWNSFKNRYKWTSAEMFLRRFSAAFRTASIKNTQMVASKVSRKNQCDGVLLK